MSYLLFDARLHAHAGGHRPPRRRRAHRRDRGLPAPRAAAGCGGARRRPPVGEPRGAGRRTLEETGDREADVIAGRGRPLRCKGQLVNLSREIVARGEGAGPRAPGLAQLSHPDGRLRRARGLGPRARPRSGGLRRRAHGRELLRDPGGRAGAAAQPADERLSRSPVVERHGARNPAGGAGAADRRSAERRRRSPGSRSCAGRWASPARGRAAGRSRGRSRSGSSAGPSRTTGSTAACTRSTGSGGSTPCITTRRRCTSSSRGGSTSARRSSTPC